MRIKNVTIRNFCSYPLLEFDFSDLGLSLLSGETGSGKSSVMDAVSWLLFGTTSKDQAADAVCSWDAEEPTEGTAEVDDITVTRIRGGNKNDLYWTEAGIVRRGKDLADTQKLLEKRLGVTAELFLVGSYLTQFSKADSFFIAKAKERREVLEKIADQEFAISLGVKASEARKIAKKDNDSLELELSREQGRQETLSQQCQSLLNSKNKWDLSQKDKIVAIEQKFERFDSDTAREVQNLAERMSELDKQILDDDAFEQEAKNTSAKIADLSQYRERADELSDNISRLHAERSLVNRQIATLLKSKDCPTCKRPMEKQDCAGPLKTAQATLEGIEHELAPLEQAFAALQHKLKEESALKAELSDISANRDKNNKLIQQFSQLADKATMFQTAQNPHGDQLKAARSEVNPFIKERQDAITALQKAEDACQGLGTQAEAKSALVASLTWLYDKSMELRGLMMARAVAQIEKSTNDYLERFFDAALRVKFDTSDSDKLEVEISNDGHSCNFKSLSGGERTMLKLAFSLSLMQAAQDKAGVSFNMIMLDEPFSGLSGDLKVKAFGLLQQLEQEYPTVLVIDHDTEIKSHFHKTFAVEKTGGHSEIHELLQEGS